MFHKALWMKEWKHSSLISFSIFIIFIIAYPIKVGIAINNWKERNALYPQTIRDEYFEINFLFSSDLFSVIAVLLIILLAGFLVGNEKSTKRHDFSMALPFSKMEMFITKYLLGMFVIIISYILNFWLAYLIVYQSEYKSMLLEHLLLTNAFISPMVAYITIFSFAMLIGSITGDMKSQVSLTLLFLVLPQGLLIILGAFFETHGFDARFIFENDFVFSDIFWFKYLNILTSHNILIPIIATIIFFIVGLYAFQSAQSEYSGEFLMHKRLRPIFAFIIPFCSALLGGLIVGGIVSYAAASSIKISVYWLGVIIALFFSWKITKRLLRI